MEPQRLIGQAVHTDDHRGRHVGRLEDSAKLRDQLTVTGEHDCLRRICRDVDRDLPTTVVTEGLADDHPRSLIIHDRSPILESWPSTSAKSCEMSAPRDGLAGRVRVALVIWCIGTQATYQCPTPVCPHGMSE